MGNTNSNDDEDDNNNGVTTDMSTEDNFTTTDVTNNNDDSTTQTDTMATMATESRMAKHIDRNKDDGEKDKKKITNAVAEKEDGEDDNDDRDDDGMDWWPMFGNAVVITDSTTTTAPTNVSSSLSSTEREESVPSFWTFVKKEPTLRKTMEESTGTNFPNASDDDDEDRKTTTARSISSLSSNTYQSISTIPWAKVVGYAILLWVLHFIGIVTLRQMGYIETEFPFDDALNTLIPQIDRQLRMLNETIQTASLPQEPTRPGYLLAQQGAKAHHPVILIPGFITSGLEVWSGRDCAKQHFRQRLWTAFGSVGQFLSNRDCWFQHMSLNPYTGNDPEGIHIRPAQGFEAADYFIANYWVWGKIIHNLADLGYNPSLLALESYDWRLAYPIMEVRDGYFTQLKSQIENMHQLQSEKVVLVAHSMGALVIHYFFAWVTTSKQNGGGGGGKDWVDRHVHAYVNIAGPHLGVPKAVTALLSGEMSDTSMLGPVTSVVERVFGRQLRRDMFNTWGSLWTMLPKGGNPIWGSGADFCTTTTTTTTSTVDDEENDNDPLCPKGKDTMSPIITRTDSSCTGNTNNNNNGGADDVKDDHNGGGGADNDDEESIVDNVNTKMDDQLQQHWYVEDTIDFLQEFGGGLGPNVAASQFFSHYGKAKSSPKVWHDPMRTPLPHAPNMKIFCLYGVGLQTERAYFYKANENATVTGEGADDIPIIMDTTVHNAKQNVKYGVRYADGDGSVPLVSLGYVCADVWQRRRSTRKLNPSKIKVYTREYQDQIEFQVDDPMRHGPRAADHIDIMGNVDMMEDLLRIVSNFHPPDENQIVSNIEQIAQQINNKRQTKLTTTGKDKARTGRFGSRRKVSQEEHYDLSSSSGVFDAFDKIGL